MRTCVDEGQQCFQRTLEDHRVPVDGANDVDDLLLDGAAQIETQPCGQA